MKKIFLIVLLLPTFLFGQTETEQKRKVRDENNKPQLPPQSNPTPYYYYSQPISPMYWNNLYQDRNYNNNGRFYNNDRSFNYTPHTNIPKNTKQGPKTQFRFGAGYSTKNEASAWGTIGEKNYLVGEFSKKIVKNRSEFYPKLTMDQVLTWNDQKLDNIEDNWSIYLGVGRKVKAFSGYIMVGWVIEEDHYQYFDETYILSNNGRYSFKNFMYDYMSVKFGIIKDHKPISLRVDYDPIRAIFSFGTAISF